MKWPPDADYFIEFFGMGLAGYLLGDSVDWVFGAFSISLPPAIYYSFLILIGVVVMVLLHYMVFNRIRSWRRNKR